MRSSKPKWKLKAITLKSADLSTAQVRHVQITDN